MEDTNTGKIEKIKTMTALAKKARWAEVMSFWEENPEVLFTNEMLRFLANHMMHPDYKNEGDDLAFKLLKLPSQKRMRHLHISGNWVLWEGIVASNNLELVEAFVKNLTGDNIINNAGARLGGGEKLIEVIAKVIEKRTDISSSEALTLIRRNIHEKSRFKIAKAAFYLLDGEYYWEGLRQMNFRTKEVREYFKDNFEGGVFLQDKKYMESVFLNNAKKYLKEEYTLCDEALFVLFKDLDRCRSEILGKLIQEHPNLLNIKMLSPFTTKFLMKKEISGLKRINNDFFQRKM